jgi:hypothetical protein
MWCLVVFVFLVLPLVVAAAPPRQGQNRTQVFVVALSEDLSHKAAIINQILRKVMQGVPGIQMMDPAKKLQSATPVRVQKLLDTARGKIKAAKQSIREMEYSQVVRNATEARAAFEKMGGHIEPIDRYKESILLIAVGESMQGNKDRARKAFLDLILLDRQLTLSKTAYEGFVLEQFNEVKSTMNGQPLGSLAIKTDPPGGSLYLDGQLKGVTPESLDGLIAGKHLVVVKKPGYENWGQVIQVDAGNLVSLSPKLTPGKAGSGFARTVERAGKAISDEELRGEVLRLGQTLGLDWVFLCQLQHGEYETKLTGYLFEFSQSRVLFKNKLVIDASDYGMDEEVRNFGKAFLRSGLKALRKFREEGDPLTSRSGTEDWYRDDSAKKKEHAETHAKEEDKEKPEEKTGDPLDDRDGTEDW